MILLEHKVTGEGMVVESTDGYDLATWRVVATGVSGFEGKRWDRVAQSFVARTKAAAEVTTESLRGDPRWQQLETATPAQLDAFLAANVPDAGVRQVLRVLLLAVQVLLRSRSD